MVLEEKIINCILEGRTFEDDKEASHLDELYKTFNANVEKDEKENTLELFGKSELQRILIIKEFFEWIPIPESYFKRFQKSTSISASLRERGNRAFSSEDYEKALRAYNLAISFAKPGEPELALAYEKRADLFLTLNETDLAQRDINLAAGSGYPKKSGQKLIDLQNRCTVQSNANRKRENVEQTRTLNEARRFCHDKFFRLKSPHPKIQNVEDFVEIDYRNECGRRVIVTRDVSAGTVMLIDSPYAFVLGSMLKWDTQHCHSCSLPILGGIPCHGCTFAWFCSDSCLANATNGIHRLEHNYLPYLQCHPMAFRIVTAARILFTVGSDQLFKIFKSRDPLYFSKVPGAARGYNDDGVYEINSYLPIFHLISHSPSNFIRDLSDVFKALLLTNLIEQTTNFFRRPNYTQNCTKEDFKDFVASILLRQMRSFEFNAITLSKLESRIFADPNNNPTTVNPSLEPDQADETSLLKTIRYGAAVYPVLCLLNHSCDPNSVPVRSLRHAKTSVVALKNLKRGDEICISYTPSFTTHDTEERLKYLYDRYKFHCTCEACNNMWSNAKRTNVFGESNCDKCHRYLLTGQCPACALRDKNMPQLLDSLTMQANHAESLMDEHRYKEAEELLATCLNMCNSFSSCFNLYIELQQLYKRALVGLFNQ